MGYTVTPQLSLRHPFRKANQNMTLRRIRKSKIATQRARRLRKTMTLPERALWRLLRDRRLAELKFRRQQPVGNYIADFFCESANLLVELDGASHDGHAGHDLHRQAWFESQGLRVLRVSNSDMMRDAEAVMIGVAKAAGIDVNGWLKGGSNLVEMPVRKVRSTEIHTTSQSPPPHPGPLPEERENI